MFISVCPHGPMPAAQRAASPPQTGAVCSGGKWRSLEKLTCERRGGARRARGAAPRAWRAARLRARPPARRDTRRARPATGAVAAMTQASRISNLLSQAGNGSPPMATLSLSLHSTQSFVAERLLNLATVTYAAPAEPQPPPCTSTGPARPSRTCQIQIGSWQARNGFKK